MMAGSHMALGAALWAVTAHACQLDPFDPVPLAVAVAGSLAPDMDHPQSWAGHRFRLISVPLSLLVGHRGITHSALAVLLCLSALTLWQAHSPWTLPFVVGYLSHLLADGLTPAGVPLLWPLRWRFALGIARTGGLVEYVLVATMLTAAGALIRSGP